MQKNKKKKLLFSAYSLDMGGIETALVTLLNVLSEKYDITLFLERKQGVFLNSINNKIKIVEYRPSYFNNVMLSKCINLCKRMKFIMQYKNKFDFSCSYATYCQMASFVARNGSKNNLLWVHNNYYYFFEKQENEFIKFFDSIKSHNFKNIIFVSEEAKNQYINIYGVKKEKAIICNNLIDANRIIELSQKNIIQEKNTNTVTFVNVARHDEHQKKISRIIECAKLLKQDNENFRILLVGDGKDTENYKKDVKENNLENYVIFLGSQVNPYPYFNISDYVILTSDYEGYPVTFIEAQILNKPILTTNVSDSIKDINGKYGIVVEKDVNKIYNAMKKLIENGFEINTKFNSEEFNERIINKIEKIINERD